MAAYTWLSAVSGDWSTSTLWNPTGVPGSAGGDTATINATGSAYTITYNETTENLNSLTINSANASLVFNASDDLHVSGTTLLEAGTIDITAASALLSTSGLTASSGTIIDLGAGDGFTFTSASLSGFVDLTGTTSFGSTNASITLSGTIESTGGTGTVNFSGISGSGILEANGATMLVTGVLASTSVTAVISNSASSVFKTSGALYYGSTVKISFQGPTGEFAYTDAASDSHVNYDVSGLNAGSSATTPTNFLDLPTGSLTATGTGTGTTGTVTLSNGDTLNLTGITGFGSLGWQAETISDGSGGTDVFLFSVCYAAGTRILTPDGEKTVESLAKDDLVLTALGEHLIPRPVKWVGRRRIDLTAHPRPETVAPILIERHAFAHDIPSRDLYVSPDHGILADGRLICARQLVNGATIRQQHGCDAVEYFHIELDTHAILLAEGLTAESYLDTGNRTFFANASDTIILHPDLTAQTDNPARETGSCAPFVWDADAVRPIWEALAARAAELGRPVPRHDTTNDPDLTIVANGRPLRPVHAANGRHQVILPAGVTEVRLVSRAAAPTDTRPWLEDRRRLGVYVERIVLRGANEILDVPLDHPALQQGWWSAEQAGHEMRRWTNGDTVLPLTVKGPTILEITATNAGMAYCLDSTPQRKAA